MADNFLTPNGSRIAAKEIGGVKYQKIINYDSSGNEKSTMDALNFLDDKVTNRPNKEAVTNISTATTTTVLTGSGGVATIRVLGGTLGNVTAYDNTAGSGAVIVPTVTPVQGQVLAENIVVGTGITIVTAAATLVQVTYHP